VQERPEDEGLRDREEEVIALQAIEKAGQAPAFSFGFSRW
jgi:hypothetical protein